MGLRLCIKIVVVFASSIINCFSRPLYNVDKQALKVKIKTVFDDENMKNISIQESQLESSSGQGSCFTISLLV